MLKVISPETFLLRSKPAELSTQEVANMIREHGFYEVIRNPGGYGFSHQYKEQIINGDKIISDEVTGLMWQQGGSSDWMKFEDTDRWIEKLNQKGYGGFSNWRLPTLEEAMSLNEPNKNKDGLNIDPIFDKRHKRIWTADLVKDQPLVWVVGFGHGGCRYYEFYSSSNYVRAVRCV